MGSAVATGVVGVWLVGKFLTSILGFLLTDVGGDKSRASEEARGLFLLASVLRLGLKAELEAEVTGGWRKLLDLARLSKAWVEWISIILGKPGGNPGGKWPLAFGSVKEERPDAKKGNGEGRPSNGWTAGLATLEGGGGGGGGKGFDAALKGWKGDSLLEVRPFLVGEK